MPETPSLVSVWAIVTTLVVFGIVFKRGQAALLRRVPTLGAGLVQTMFQELTLLGALGLLLFTVEEAGMLQGLSEALFGDTTTLPALVRGVDLVRGDASWRVWLARQRPPCTAVRIGHVTVAHSGCQRPLAGRLHAREPKRACRYHTSGARLGIWAGAACCCSLARLPRLCRH